MINKVLILGSISLTLAPPVHATFSNIGGYSSSDNFVSSDTSGSIGTSWFDESFEMEGFDGRKVLDFSEFPAKVLGAVDVPMVDRPDPKLTQATQLDKTFRELTAQLSDDFVTKFSKIDQETYVLDQIQNLDGDYHTLSVSQDLLLDLKKINRTNPDLFDLVLKEYVWQEDTLRKRKLMRFLNPIVKDSSHPCHQQVCLFMAKNGKEKELYNFQYYISNALFKSENQVSTYDAGIILEHIKNVLDQPNVYPTRVSKLKKLRNDCQQYLNLHLGYSE